MEKVLQQLSSRQKNPTEQGAQELSSDLMAEIVVVNLIDCVSFSKDILRIKPEDVDSFTVETNGCGVSNSIRLESDLAVSSERFTLGETDSKEIEVLAEKNIPGQYPIKVYVKGSDQVQEKLIKTVRARILASGCIELSRYEFDVFDNPDDPYDGYDTVEVINRCYNKPVTARVKFDEHDWMEAMKTGAIYGLISGLVGGFTRDEGTKFMTGNAIKDSTVEKAEKAVDTGTAINTTAQHEIDQYSLYGGYSIEEQTITEDGKSFTATTSDGTEITGTINKDGLWDTILERPAVPLTTTRGTPPANFALGSLTGYNIMGGFGGGGNSGILGGMGGMLGGMTRGVMGKPSFMSYGLQGFIAGTLIAYNNQDEGEFSFTTIHEDLIYKATELLMPGATLEEDKLIETPSTDIIVRGP